MSLPVVHDIIKKYPNIHILAAQPTNQSQVKAMQVMQDCRTRHNTVDGVFRLDDNLGIGALRAIGAAGLPNKIKVVGAGCFGVGYDAIAKGEAYYGSVRLPGVRDTQDVGDSYKTGEMGMTSRERVRAILNHKGADKIPVDCGGMHSSGISAMAYNALKRHLGIAAGKTKIYDVIQQLAMPEQWLLDRFSVDTIDLARSFGTAPEDWRDWTLPDGSPGAFPAWINLKRQEKAWVCLNDEGEVVASMPEGMFYFSQTVYPFYRKEEVEFSDLSEQLKRVSWLTLADPLWKDADKKDFYRSIGAKAKRLYEETDYSIVANYGSLVFEPGQWLYRNDEFFVKMLTEPKEVTALFEKLTELHLQRLGPFLEQVAPYADVLVMGDDLGMQSGPLISPQTYRSLVYPWHKKIFEFVKKNSPLKTFLHSCGSFVEIIPHLIEAGLDVLNPVQTSASGMEAGKLKQEFGKDLVFWGGGIDTQHILPSEDTTRVREEVRKNCQLLMKDGGFVFNQIHNVLPGTPPENVVTMFDEANAIRY